MSFKKIFKACLLITLLFLTSDIVYQRVINGRIPDQVNNYLVYLTIIINVLLITSYLINWDFQHRNQGRKTKEDKS